MKTILYPAIALMSRLSFAMKFSLISVMFFLPMLVTNFYLVRDSYDQFLGTRIELDSLDLLGKTLGIQRDTESLSNLVEINSLIGQSGNAGDIEGRVSQLQGTLVEGIGALQPAGGSAQQVEDFNAKRDELLAGMKAAQAETSLQNKSAMVDQQLGRVQAFVAFVASEAGLSQDPDRAVRQITELVTTSTLKVTDTLGAARATGAYSLGLGFLNSVASNRMDELVATLEKLEGEYAVALENALSSSAQARATLDAQAQASRGSLKEASTLIEDKVTVADTLDTPWPEYYEDISAQMAKSYRLSEAALDFLDSQLQQRLAEHRRQMVLLVVALIAVFLLIGYLYGGFYESTRSTLKSLGQVMDKVAAGDMTVSFKAQTSDELGELGQVFNGTVVKIHDLIQRVGLTVVEVERQADRVEVVSGESNQAVAGQRSQIEQVATAMNQMSATAQEVARSAAAAVDSAHSVNQETVSGRELVESQVGSIQRLAGEIDQSVLVINQLASDSQSISQVLDVIKGIAEQTNLLALNAAIEAARAGEQGRGFAVVADEVRNLARRTQQSTEEIEQMIARLQGGVGAAVKAMNASHRMADGTVDESGRVQRALENILGAVGMIVDQSQQIAAAAEQQTAVAHDIDQNIVQINQAGERTAEGASQTELASRELSELVGDLKQLIGAFRV